MMRRFRIVGLVAWYLLASRLFCEAADYDLSAPETGRHVAYCLSTDGTLFARASDSVKVWSLTDRKLAYEFPNNGTPLGLAISPDGKLLAVASAGASIWRLSKNSQEPLHKLESGGAIRNVAFNAASDMVVVLDDKAGITLWKLGAGDPVQVSMNKPVHGQFALSPNGEYIAKANQEGIELLRFPKMEHGWLLPIAGESGAPHFAFSPDSKRLAVAGEKLRLWTFPSFDDRLEIDEHFNGFTRVGFSGDGKFLAASKAYRGLHLYDAESHKLVAKFAHGIEMPFFLTRDELIFPFQDCICVRSIETVKNWRLEPGDIAPDKPWLPAPAAVLKWPTAERAEAINLDAKPTPPELLVNWPEKQAVRERLETQLASRLGPLKSGFELSPRNQSPRWPTSPTSEIKPEDVAKWKLVFEKGEASIAASREGGIFVGGHITESSNGLRVESLFRDLWGGDPGRADYESDGRFFTWYGVDHRSNHPLAVVNMQLVKGAPNQQSATGFNLFCPVSFEEWKTRDAEKVGRMVTGLGEAQALPLAARYFQKCLRDPTLVQEIERKYLPASLDGLRVRNIAIRIPAIGNSGWTFLIATDEQWKNKHTWVLTVSQSNRASLRMFAFGGAAVRDSIGWQREDLESNANLDFTDYLADAAEHEPAELSEPDRQLIERLSESAHAEARRITKAIDGNLPSRFELDVIDGLYDHGKLLRLKSDDLVLRFTDEGDTVGLHQCNFRAGRLGAIDNPDQLTASVHKVLATMCGSDQVLKVGRPVIGDNYIIWHALAFAGDQAATSRWMCNITAHPKRVDNSQFHGPDAMIHFQFLKSVPSIVAAIRAANEYKRQVRTIDVLPVAVKSLDAMMEQYEPSASSIIAAEYRFQDLDMLLQRQGEKYTRDLIDEAEINALRARGPVAPLFFVDSYGSVGKICVGFHPETGKLVCLKNAIHNGPPGGD